MHVHRHPAEKRRDCENLKIIRAKEDKPEQVPWIYPSFGMFPELSHRCRLVEEDEKFGEDLTKCKPNGCQQGVGYYRCRLVLATKAL